MLSCPFPGCTPCGGRGCFFFRPAGCVPPLQPLPSHPDRPPGREIQSGFLKARRL